MKKITALLCAFITAFTLTLCACGTEPSLPPDGENKENYVDIFVFMGQSNMAGRGTASESVKCGEGHGYEFRAVTDPTKLYPVSEPFGEYENNNGISDTSGNSPKKTGGLVSAFCEAYYAQTGVPVIGVSASQGGTSSQEWQPGNGLLEEAQSRLQTCLYYMYSQDEFTIRHIEMVWLQGENDAGNQVDYLTYCANMQNIVSAMSETGVEHCFVIQIGTYMASVSQAKYDLYRAFQKNQERMCEEYDNLTLVSKKLADMPESMMHLNNHYLQPAYNIVGTDAGKNTAYYINTGNAPVCNGYINGETVG